MANIIKPSPLENYVKSLGLNPADISLSQAKELYERGRQQSRFDKGMNDFIQRVVSQGSSQAGIPQDGARYAPAPQNYSQTFLPSTSPFMSSGEASVAQPQPNNREDIVVSHPFKVFLTGNPDDGYEATIEQNSLLLKSFNHQDLITITDLSENFAVSSGDSIWLEVQFSLWPDTYSVTAKAGDFSSTEGEFEDDLGSPPEQTFGRVVLATFANNSDGSLRVSRQYVTTNLIMKMFLVGGLPVNHPLSYP